MKKRKERAVRYFAVFLIFMLICTIVSRGIYAYQMPQVTLGSSEARTLIHTIEAYGTVLTKEEQPVTVEEGLLVEKVSVTEGQKVAKNDVLLQIDVEDLQKVLEKNQLQLQIEEAKLSEANSSKATALERANQDFKDTAASVNEKVSQANREYQEAQWALSEFPSEEEYLKAACKGDEQYQKLFKASKKKDATKEEKQAFADYQKNLTKQLQETYRQEKQTLKTNVTEKEKALNEADASRSESIKQAQRAVEDAKKTADTGSCFEQQSQISLLKKKRDVLLKLQESEGKIFSEIEGCIGRIFVHAGERTTDTAALVISDSNGEKLFQAVLPQEEKAYVNAGDTMNISFDGGKKQLYDVVIHAAGELEDGSCQVTGKLEDTEIALGESGKMTIQKDTGNYECCIPLSALYSDNGSDYVLLAKEQRTILGEELISEKRKVKVLDKDADYAALEENAVTEDEKIIIDAKKEVKAGERVRLVEE